jgi:hypothetical protein
MQWFLTVFFLLGLGWGLASSSTYYVCNSAATCGSEWADGASSNSGLAKQTPWKSLDDAEERVKGGDTVIIGSGTYRDPAREWSSVVLYLQVNGQGNQITIRSEKLHGAVIDATGKHSGVWIDGSAGYVTLDGFAIKHANIAGINAKDSDDRAPYKRATNIRLINLFVVNNGRSGITLQEVDDSLIENCDIHTLTIPHENYNHYHGIYLSDNTNNIVVRNNRVSNIPYGWPIHIYDGHGRGPATNHVIVGNILIDENTRRDGGLVLYGSGHLVKNNVVESKVDAPGYRAMIYNNRLSDTSCIENNKTNLPVLCERYSTTATSCSGAIVSENQLLNVDLSAPQLTPPPTPAKEPVPEPTPIIPDWPTNGNCQCRCEEAR